MTVYTFFDEMDFIADYRFGFYDSLEKAEFAARLLLAEKGFCQEQLDNIYKIVTIEVN